MSRSRPRRPRYAPSRDRGGPRSGVPGRLRAREPPPGRRPRGTARPPAATRPRSPAWRRSTASGRPGRRMPVRPPGSWAVGAAELLVEAPAVRGVEVLAAILLDVLDEPVGIAHKLDLYGLAVSRGRRSLDSGQHATEYPGGVGEDTYGCPANERCGHPYRRGRPDRVCRARGAPATRGESRWES